MCKEIPKIIFRRDDIQRKTLITVKLKDGI